MPLIRPARLVCLAACVCTAILSAQPSVVRSADGPPVSTIVPDGRPHKFEARDQQFFIDGQPTLLLAGEMHFGRVQPEDWDTRLKQAKAMGLNAVSFYLFWNTVESKEGQFTFSGLTDVRHVLELCRQNGLWAILRPGPYCCAEVEYGGIPWWTAKYPDVKIRTADPKYVEWSRRYIEQVYRQVGDLQVSRGGPLVMVQIENEYGNARPANNDYMVALHKIFRDVGFDCQLFICDPFPTPATRLLPGVMAEQNGLKGPASPSLRAALGGFPVYVPEVYTAWFTGLGQPLATRNSAISDTLNWVGGLLDNRNSFCLYMFFGGTSYGFSNGCNENLPVQTSYDYGAPIDEAGRVTEKYRALRTLLSTRLGLQPPEPPPDPAVITLPAIRLTEHEPLLATLPAAPTRSAAKPVAMENLDQDYGFVLYRKTFPAGLKGALELKQVQDYAVVMVNGKTVAKAFRGYGPDSSKVQLDEAGPVTLDILVYNLGRISVITNAASQDRASKGLIGGAWLDGAELSGWDMFSLPLPAGAASFQASTAPHIGPTFYRGTFDLAAVGGTFLDLRNWGFGVVWVNGHNLGRFTDRGAIRSLFLPAQWLKAGANEITVLELHDAPKVPEISGTLNAIEETAVPFPVALDRGVRPAGLRGFRGRGPLPGPGGIPPGFPPPGVPPVTPPPAAPAAGNGAP